jgi:hypothetical protein
LQGKLPSGFTEEAEQAQGEAGEGNHKPDQLEGAGDREGLVEDEKGGRLQLRILPDGESRIGGLEFLLKGGGIGALFKEDRGRIVFRNPIP